jgi:hypothetical protein
MSILRVDAIRDNGSGFNDVVTFANSGGTENGKLARAWVNFNGTGTVAIRAQFNVSSITDNGTGDYTVNFSNAMSDANYAPSGFVHRTSNVLNHIDLLQSKTSSAYRFTTSQTTNGAVVGLSSVDVSEAYLTFFR